MAVGDGYQKLGEDYRRLKSFLLQERKMKQEEKGQYPNP